MSPQAIVAMLAVGLISAVGAVCSGLVLWAVSRSAQNTDQRFTNLEARLGTIEGALIDRGLKT